MRSSDTDIPHLALIPDVTKPRPGLGLTGDWWLMAPSHYWLHKGEGITVSVYQPSLHAMAGQIIATP